MTGFLAIDIGNSRLHLGWFEHGAIVRKRALSVENLPSQLSRVEKEGFDRVGVASVNPPALEQVQRWLPKKIPVVSVSPGCCDRLTINYDPVSSLGADRLAAAVAAKRLYGAPAVVVDAGTAATVDLLGPDGGFDGGYIFPGPDLCLQALHASTSLLPRLKSDPQNLAPMPRTTADCMNSGVVNGFAGALCALIAAVRERTPGARVIVSGGASDLLRGHLPDAVFDPDLTLKGIFLCAGAQPV